MFKAKDSETQLLASGSLIYWRRIILFSAGAVAGSISKKNQFALRICVYFAQVDQRLFGNGSKFCWVLELSVVSAFPGGPCKC